MRACAMYSPSALRGVGSMRKLVGLVCMIFNCSIDRFERRARLGRCILLGRCFPHAMVRLLAEERAASWANVHHFLCIRRAGAPCIARALISALCGQPEH